MTTSGLPDLEKAAQEGREAALIYTDINDACPYPFGTPLAIAFRQGFEEPIGHTTTNNTSTAS